MTHVASFVFEGTGSIEHRLARRSTRPCGGWPNVPDERSQLMGTVSDRRCALLPTAPRPSSAAAAGRLVAALQRERVEKTTWSERGLIDPVRALYRSFALLPRAHCAVARFARVSVSD